MIFTCISVSQSLAGSQCICTSVHVYSYNKLVASGLDVNYV